MFDHPTLGSKMVEENFNMQVSIIIPVYNAVDFVRQSVESALMQPETEEVILVEDGSPDNSLEVCKQLAVKYAKVHLFRHPDGGNYGAGATRNLAIQKSVCEYIAFLDADDYFLPGRFSVAKGLFSADPDLEGVYEAIAMHVEDERSAERWRASGRSQNQLHTMIRRVLPEDLFEALFSEKYRDFSIDGLVLKRNVMKKTGYMDEDLLLHQDSVFIRKAAGVAKLMPGRLDEPVAKWRVHDHNRISAPRDSKKVFNGYLSIWKTLYLWSKNHLDSEKCRITLNKLLIVGTSFRRFNKPPRRGYRLRKLYSWILLLADCPGLILEAAYWHFPIQIIGNDIEEHPVSTRQEW